MHGGALATMLRGNIMSGAPLVTLHVVGPLRAYCAGRSELSLSGATVRAVLEELERTHAALHRNICDESGRVRKHLNVFVNAAHVRDLDGIDSPVKAGDVVSVLPAVSGG